MKRATLIPLMLALLLGSAGQARAGLIGPTYAPPYTYGSDGASNVLVTYTAFPFAGAGTVNFLQSANLDEYAWTPGESFTALQLRPAGGSSYTVIAEQTFTTSSTLGIVQYTLSTPWSVQAGDIYAHYGQGIPFSLPATSNPPDPLYYPSSHDPAMGETIALGGADYPAYGQSRDYYLDANFNPASAAPEPATLTLLGIGIVGMAGYGWRRRKLAVA
jgi:hypothetical protein